MGLFGSKSNSNTKSSGTDNFNDNTNFNTTPTNPQWVTDAAKGIYGGGQTLAKADPASYVAGPNDLLTQAGAGASSLTSSPWNYDAAADLTRGVANTGAPDISSMIGKFMSPYLSSVVDATGADLDHQAGLTRAQDDLTLAGSGAFGGSGAALTKAATEGELARTRATTLSGLRNQGYAEALAGATSQAGLQQQQQQQKLASAAQLAGISSQSAADNRANVAAQDAAAAPLQAIAQSKATAPLDLQTWLASIFAGSQPGLFQGQTGTEDQTGTEVQTGKGNTSGTTFGFGGK